MLTVLLAPEHMLDEHEKRDVGHVRQYGFFTTPVMGETGSPEFSYTTGFWYSLAVPEIITFSINNNAHDIFWEMCRDIKRGVQFPLGQRIPNILKAHDIVLLPLDKRHYEAHLGRDMWFYGSDDFPCVQLVWPDKQNIFPWQPGFDSGFAKDQPALWQGSPSS